MRTILGILLFASVFLWSIHAFAQDDPYGGVYTAAELAALDKALWSQNLTRADLNFDKDYAKGYECFPIVREMMADPLAIGMQIDAFAKRLPSDFNPLAIATQLEQMAGRSKPTFIANIEQQSIRSWIPDFEVQPRPGIDELIVGVDTPQALLDILGEMMSSQVMGGLSGQINSWDVLREMLPQKVIWHEIESPYMDQAWARSYFGVPDMDLSDWKQRIHAAYDDDTLAVFRTASSITINLHQESRLGWLLTTDPREWLTKLPDSVWPTEHPISIITGAGQITIGTTGNDVYYGDYACLIDPGGDDIYYDSRLGACYGLHQMRLGYFVDLGGDDLYDCGDIDVTLGAAILGFGFFYDLGGGNDRYYAGSVSLGAAIGGVATFYDDGGSDYYSGKVYTQGAAGFGIAVMCDDSVLPAPDIPTDEETPDPIDLAAFDNDHYTAWCEAQGFARTRGVAICTNARGNEVYHAGGVYLHAPLFSDRYQSFSQGFAIGERGIDYAGGIALLADYSGNDRYLGDVYNQGVGYWYSAGFLYDGGGNDHYEMTQYGQGSGIHLAVGGLIDEAGSDTYIMHSGLGQGGSHDYAASVFMDRGGDDRYLGNTSCNGCGLTNSVGLFFDRGGNDVYAAKRDAMNTGRPARGFGSIGVLVDLGGTDDYLGPYRDDTLWTVPQYGMGLDVGEVFAPLVFGSGTGALAGQTTATGENARPTDQSSGFDTPRGDLKLPEVLAYDGPLTQAVFDELWELAIRWEVGDNRVIVPAARKRLVEFGPAVLPLVAARMGDQDSGLALRAQVDVFKGVIEQGTASASNVASTEEGRTGATPTVHAILSKQLTSGDETRIRNALQLIAELKLTDMGPSIAPLVDSADPALQRRAVSALGTIDSHSADDKLLALLRLETEEKLLKVAVEAVTNLELNCFDLLRPLLEHDSFAVRDTLEHQLAAHIGAYESGLREFAFQHQLWPGSSSVLPLRALRSAYRVYTRADLVPDSTLLELFHYLTRLDEPGLNLEAARLLRHWAELVEDQELRNELLFGAQSLEPEGSHAVLNLDPAK